MSIRDDAARARGKWVRYKERFSRAVAGKGPIALYAAGVLTVFHGIHLWSAPVSFIFLGACMVNWALKLDPVE